MNNVLEDAIQMELKFKNKIIELERELEYQNLRANQYEAKFREAVLENSNVKTDQHLLDTLSQTEKQLAKARRDLLQANRKNSSSPSDVLVSQNEELRNIVEELKNAAVSAIMQKQTQIEQLKAKVQDLEDSDQVYTLSEKNQELETRISKITEQLTLQISNLNKNLNEERENFADKLTLLQKENSYEENAKYELIKKAENLEGNLQSMEKNISQYEQKMLELEQEKSSLKIMCMQTEHKHKIQSESLKGDMKILMKDLQQRNKQIQLHLHTIENQKKSIQSAIQDKQELERKLKIKNRKQNPQQIQTQSIFESFQGFSQKANLFTSFARPDNSNFSVKESFIGTPMKLSQISELEIGEIQNFTEEIQSQMNHNFQTTEQPNRKESNEEVKTLMTQIDRLNAAIDQLTNELQVQRRAKLELREKLNKQQSMYKIDRESQRQHIFKLENALLIQKLQNAEKLESNKQIREYEKRLFNEELTKLKKELESPKKKKGFFG